MASSVLYPPSIDHYAKAFVAENSVASLSKCRIYFSLSKMSSSAASINGIHISVIKQSSGQSVVNKTNNTVSKRFRSSGIIILNEKPKKVENEDNLYYVDIYNEDIKGGWTQGWIYKIQIRLSTIPFPESEAKPATWLVNNGNCFSEWSTYCTTKAIGQPVIQIPILNNYDSSTNSDIDSIQYNFNFSTLEISGSYSNSDKTENLYSYQFILKENDELIEDSGILYPNQYLNPNQLYYLFKHEFLVDDNTSEKQKKYNLIVKYETVNKYSNAINFNFVTTSNGETEDIYVYTVENGIPSIHSHFNNEAVLPQGFSLTDTSISKEEDDGRIKLQVYCPELNNKNICIRRSSEKNNFTTWEDVKVIPSQGSGEVSVTFYDNTIESGVLYKYAAQAIDLKGYRSILNTKKGTLPVKREFEYAYLIGENGRQLKMNLSLAMQSYAYTYSDSKTDTIGGKYPFITRNGNMSYRAFPLSGIISFQMDDMNTFTSLEELYSGASYEYHKNDKVDLYNYKLEYDFREKVLAFLQDGKPKLFKSSTEGNIIVRLMNITFTGNQSLNRMVGNFNANAVEIADDTFDNYLKYNLVNFETLSTENEKELENKILYYDDILYNGQNFISELFEKYKYTSEDGTLKQLYSITNLIITFEDEPVRLKDNYENTIYANGFEYNNSKFIIPNIGYRQYNFDTIVFTKEDEMNILGDILDPDRDVHMTATFVGSYINANTERRLVGKNTEPLYGFKQIHEVLEPGEDIRAKIEESVSFKGTYLETSFVSLESIMIEAAPGATFKIKEADGEEDLHQIGFTGILNLSDIGKPYQEFTYESESPCEVVISYIYTYDKELYQKEEL